MSEALASISTGVSWGRAVDMPRSWSATAKRVDERIFETDKTHYTTSERLIEFAIAIAATPGSDVADIINVPLPRG